MTWHPASQSGRPSAAELYENAKAEQALVLSIGGPTAPWEECAVAFQLPLSHGETGAGIVHDSDDRIPLPSQSEARPDCEGCSATTL
jgi:hypothetical protein